MTARSVLTALAVAAPLAAAGACASALPHAEPRDTEWARARWPETGEAALEDGRARYVQTCAGCHALKLPRDVEPGRWQIAVNEMKREHGVVISLPDERLIVRYLVTMSTRERPAPSE